MAAKAQPKKYGLIIPSTKKGATSGRTLKKPSVFESSSEEECDSGPQKISSLWRENKKNTHQMESHGQMVKALEEDPSVFEYDNIYDEMQEKKKANQRQITKDRSSKYIASLKQVAERRKLEQEIIYERMVQRDMEKEGEKCEEKDTFLTSAYRKKLQERRLLEEELKMAAYREEADDVTKQKDMSKFHRTLLNQITVEGGGSGEGKEKSSRLEDVRGRRVSLGKKSVAGMQEQNQDGEDRDKEEPSDSITIDSGQQSPGGERLVSDPVVVSSSDSGQLFPDGERLVSDTVVVSSSDSRLHDETKELDKRNGEEAELAQCLPAMDKEMRRKIASAKRSNEETLSSAKERYLARKRTKLSTPVISSDD